jgi:hypothetical protein
MVALSTAVAEGINGVAILAAALDIGVACEEVGRTPHCARDHSAASAANAGSSSSFSSFSLCGRREAHFLGEARGFCGGPARGVRGSPLLCRSSLGVSDRAPDVKGAGLFPLRHSSLGVVPVDLAVGVRGHAARPRGGRHARRALRPKRWAVFAEGGFTGSCGGSVERGRVRVFPAHLGSTRPATTRSTTTTRTTTKLTKTSRERVFRLKDNLRILFFNK